MRVKSARPQSGTMKLVMFDDQQDSYPDASLAWNFQCGSEELNRAAKFQRDIDVSRLPDSGYEVPQYITQHIRPRWWYVAVIDCSGIERTIDYSIHMLNIHHGWQQEFSMDHCGLASLHFVFLIFVVLGCAQQYAIKQNTENAKHPLRLMLAASLAAACLGMLFQVGDAFWFANHGTNMPSLYLGGKVCKVLSKGLLASILVLLSWGVCISEPLRGKHLLQVSQLLTPFFGACLVLELWGEYSQSRTYTTGFIYCTHFGEALVAADMLFLFYYIKNLHDSASRETQEDKKQFYNVWGLSYSLAFAVLPFAAFLSTLVAPWVQNQAIFLTTNLVHAALLGSLVVGLWPERTQSFFCLQVDNKELATTIGITLPGMDELSYAHIGDSPTLLASSSPKMKFAMPKLTGTNHGCLEFSPLPAAQDLP